MPCAAVAQLVEHSTENARVAGSNPACGTIRFLLILLLSMGIAFGQDLTLRPFDRIRVNSTGAAAMSGDLAISSTGFIRLSNGLTASIAGLSLEDASREIQRVVGPSAGRVGIELIAPLEGSVSFRGAVRRSGSVTLRSPKSLAELIALAEPTDSADLSEVLVISASGRTFRVDAESNADFSMRAGDQILVLQSTVPNEILVLGAVKNPGSIPFKTGTTLEQAVALAGGLTGHAVLADISVLRRNEVVVGADWTDAGRATVLLKGDTVRVASQENGRYVSVLGHVKTSGLVPYRDGMTLLEAIEEAGGFIAGAGKDAVEVRKVFGGRGRTKKHDLNLVKKGTSNDPKLAAADVVFVPAFMFKEKRQDSGFKPVVPPRRVR